MDTLDKYREIIERILSNYAAVPYVNGELESMVIFDQKRDRYLLVNVGWNKNRRVHGCIIHIDIIDGKNLDSARWNREWNCFRFRRSRYTKGTYCFGISRTRVETIYWLCCSLTKRIL